MSWIRRFWFNLWYFRNPPWDTGISPPELLEFINTHPAGRALDFGCGTGTNAITLAKLGWHVVGIDYAFPAIHESRKKARQAGVNIDFRVQDVSQLQEITGQFDLILDIGCFHSLSQPGKQRYIDNLVDLLAFKGTYLLYAIFRDPLNNSRSGIEIEDIKKIESKLRLIKRSDGTDRGKRASTWLTFQR